MSGECAFCGDKNFRRMSPDISDWCLVLKSEHLSPLNGISIDIWIEPPLKEEVRFCGFGCLKKWLEKNSDNS